MYINGIQTQKTSLKMIYHKPWFFPTTQLYSETKLLSIKKLYNNKTLFYLPKNNLIFTTIHNHNLRSENLIFSKINMSKYYNSYLITLFKNNEIIQKSSYSNKNY